MSSVQSTNPVPTQQPIDDPFLGSPENWSLPDRDWPPSDPWEMAKLDAWMDEQEREYFERCGNDFGGN